MDSRAIALFFLMTGCVPLVQAAPPAGVSVAPPATAACSIDGNAGASALWGEWAVHWKPSAHGWGERAPALVERLVLARHAESPESLQGHVDTASGRVLVVGEFDDGELLMEESADGKAIRATWQARLVASGPTARFEGRWVPDPDGRDAKLAAREFVLVKRGCPRESSPTR